MFIPYEIYDLTSKITFLRVATFLVNLALVVYLVISKRLLGVRGGKKAYEAQRREGSIMEQASEAAAAKQPSPVREMRDVSAAADVAEPTAGQSNAGTLPSSVQE